MTAIEKLATVVDERKDLLFKIEEAIDECTTDLQNFTLPDHMEQIITVLLMCHKSHISDRRDNAEIVKLLMQSLVTVGKRITLVGERIDILNKRIDLINGTDESG